jgi:hypothetical protein
LRCTLLEHALKFALILIHITTRIEKRFDDQATIHDTLAQIQDASHIGFNKTANMVLDAKPNGSWGDKDTIPFEILIGGNFAAALDTSDRAKFDDVADQVYASTIVATSWYLEQVFIVKAAKTIASHDPCTAKLDFLSDARICIDDVAYIFVKTGDISKLYPDNDYPKVQGIDKLKDYGLDAKAMIRAAEWFDKEFGLKKPSNSDLKDYMTGNKKGPPGNLWVSLPVIDYEKTPSISRNAWKIYGSSWSNPWVRDDSSSTTASCTSRTRKTGLTRAWAHTEKNAFQVLRSFCEPMWIWISISFLLLCIPHQGNASDSYSPRILGNSFEIN